MQEIIYCRSCFIFAAVDSRDASGLGTAFPCAHRAPPAGRGCQISASLILSQNSLLPNPAGTDHLIAGFLIYGVTHISRVDPFPDLHLSGTVEALFIRLLTLLRTTFRSSGLPMVCAPMGGGKTCSVLSPWIRQSHNNTDYHNGLLANVPGSRQW